MIGAMFGQNLLKRMVIDLSWDYTLYYAGIAGFILAPAIWFLVRDKPADNDTTPPRQMPQSYFSYQQLFQDIIKVMRTPQIWINGLIGGLIILPTTIFAELWGAPFLEQYYALDSATAVKATSMIFLGWAMGGPLAGLISDRTQRRRLPLMLGSITGMMVLLVVIYYPPLPTVVLFSLLVLFGILSSVEIIVFAVARENSPDGVTGTAIALTNFMVVCAGFMQWLVGKMLDRLWDGTLINGYPYYSAKGYHLALMILPISMLVAFILCFALKEKRDEAGLMQAQESPK
jgi:sugar phosphate permease